MDGNVACTVTRSDSMLVGFTCNMSVSSTSVYWKHASLKLVETWWSLAENAVPPAGRFLIDYFSCLCVCVFKYVQ